MLDGFGHVSARHPGSRPIATCSRARWRRSSSRATTSSRSTSQSNAQDGDTRTPYLERFIHGEIYAQRPDVQSVVHSHAASVVPFAREFGAR